MRSTLVEMAPQWRVESERKAWPGISGRPHLRVRRLLSRDYWGVSDAVLPHRLLIPATATVPLVVKLSDSPHRPPAFLHGPHDEFALMEGDCASSYLEIQMAPLGAYQLLGRPIGQLESGIVDLESVYGADAERLVAQLRTASTWPERFAQLDRFLGRAAERGVERGYEPTPEVVRGWRLIVESHGMMPIRQVAQDVGWSHKHLITRFVQQVGMTPKSVARLQRFERVLAGIGSGRGRRLDRVAVESGYADQPHLNRDFRAFVGITPTDYLRRTSASMGNG